MMSDPNFSDPNVSDAIVPDEKDWTWVLELPCPECGFDASQVDPTDVAAMLRDNAAQWVRLLLSGDSDVRQRPEPTVWSPLEYACHVRDVFRLFDERLELMLTEDGPHYANWDQDATALEQDYRSQDPVNVATGLTDAAALLATRWDSVAGDQWQRTGFRSDGARFTVASFALYFIHDPEHHLWDVGPVGSQPATEAP